MVTAGSGRRSSSPDTASITTPKRIPLTSDFFTQEYDIDGERVVISPWDTVGRSEYNRLRIRSYRGADVVLICFSLVDKDSYDHVGSKWIHEVETYCNGAPIILVGLKSELREEYLSCSQRDLYEGMTPISTEEGHCLERSTGQ